MGDITVQIDTDVIKVTVGDDPVINVALATVDITTEGTPFTKVFTGDGTTVKFDFPSKLKSGFLLVFLSSIFQSKGVNYTEADDRKSITFVIAPKLGRKVEVWGIYD